MATMAMDSARAAAIGGATAMQRHWKLQRQRNGNGRLVIIADI
jgi:hypothetical protein